LTLLGIARSSKPLKADVSSCAYLSGFSVSLDYRTAAVRAIRGVLPGILFAACAAIFLSGSPASAQQDTKTLHIAAAADLQPVMPSLAAAYERETGVHIIASFGSSATLAQQITNGDPQDIFLSADTLHPQQLVSAGLATSLAPYARGVLVLWARSDSPAQPLTLDALTSDKIQRIAVANDLHAPYGLAATSALKAMGIYDKVKPKLVVGENIGQTAQFVLTGNAQVGLISLTIASSKAYKDAGSYVLIPRVYPEIRQSGVVLTASKNQQAAHAFLEWLTSSPVQKTLTTFGLDPAKP
jgi:molybdate transport system substrate-binding protein